MNFTYLKQPPKKYTFEQPQLKLWVEQWCIGKVLNLFGGKVRLSVDEISNDIDPEMPTDFHMDAFELVSSLPDGSFNTIVLDPPYNIRKSREKYGGRYIGKFTKIKNELPRILRPYGRTITLGYDTVGMSASRGFEKIAICVICHGGDHNDTLGLVEQKLIY